jgi:soluble lytic murein transglycosylase-like protein
LDRGKLPHTALATSLLLGFESELSLGETHSGSKPFFLPKFAEMYSSPFVMTNVILALIALLLQVLSVHIPKAHSQQQIYVIKEKDGSLLFSTRAPKDGRSAEVFSAKGARYSYSQERGFGGRLFVDRYRNEILRAAKQHGVDAALIRAVIHAESAFDPKAVSPKGAVGLMQIMPDNFKMLALSKPHDPADNIMAGTKFLAQLIDQYAGNLTLSLAAYNAGPGAVNRYGGVPPYRETTQYVRRVMHFYARYQRAI